MPFILVSGAIGEDFAIESLKKGATDYVLKSRLSRLVPAVRRAWCEAEERAERKQAEKEIRYEKDKLRKIFEAMEDGVYIVNQNYDVEYINPFLEKEFGHWRGRKCYEYFHDRTEVCPWCPNQKVFAGETVRWEWYSFKNQRTYDLIDTPLKNPDGSVSKLEIFRDITERKKADEKLRESEKKYKTLIENLPQKIFLKDKNSVYISCNENYARDLKIKSEEIAGKTDYDFYSKELAEKYRADDKRIMELGNIEDIDEKYIQNAHEVWVHTVKTPIKDEKGNVIGLLGIFWDITRKKEMEDEIKKRVKELEEFYDMAVGRELRMIELKDELEELKEELSKYKKG
ncbi:MAG: PAS domain S-box protein [Nitrospira sp.]|nr:PAS domain S-box protein [Nitrospira sp.]